MADDPKTDNTGAITMADIRKAVSEMVAEAVKGDKEDKIVDPPKPDDKPTGSVADLVRAEIEKIKAHEQQEAKDKTINDKLAELAAATAEKPPVERRRVHKIMGWGD